MPQNLYLNTRLPNSCIREATTFVRAYKRENAQRLQNKTLLTEISNPVVGAGTVVTIVASNANLGIVDGAHHHIFLAIALELIAPAT